MFCQTDCAPRSYFRGGNVHRLHMKEGIQMFTDLNFHGKVGKTVLLLNQFSDKPVYQYLFKYSATHSFGDISVYAPWKFNFKMFLQSFGVGEQNL